MRQFVNKGGFTLAEAIVSVTILALILYGTINAYQAFDKSAESVKTKVRAELFSRYIQELVDVNPPIPNGVIPMIGTSFFISSSPTGGILYSQDPSNTTSDTGFLHASNDILSHKITLVASGNSYGKTFVSYQIKTTYGEESRTTYLTK